MTIYPLSHLGNGVLAEPSMADQLAHQAHGLACQLAFCHVHYLMHVQMALHLVRPRDRRFLNDLEKIAFPRTNSLSGTCEVTTSQIGPAGEEEAPDRS